MRILIVEDAVKLAQSLKKGLKAEGYAVDVLHDGLAARKRLAAARDDADGSRYDLLLLDVMLPGVDGFTLCRELRSRGLAVPVLMLTARDATTDKVTGLDLSLIHISEPTRLGMISYAVFCLKKKKQRNDKYTRLIPLS